MASFQGNDGTEWAVVIDTTTIRRVKKLLNVNLMEVVGGTLIEELSNDPCLLVDILCVICEEKIEKLQLDEIGFAKVLVGDAIDYATVALLEALADFFPSAQRKVILAGLKTGQASMNRMEEMITGPELEAMMEKAHRKVEMKLLETLRGSGSESTNSRESSESTPVPSP